MGTSRWGARLRGAALITGWLVAWSGQGAVADEAEASAGIRIERSLMVERLSYASGGTLTRIEEPAGRLWPGAEVIYRLSYVNTTAHPQRVMVTNPLPPSVVYLSSDAAQIEAESLVSVDGGTHFGTLPVLRVRVSKAHWYPATSRDVTHVRFITERPVQPGESGQFSVRLRLK